MASACTSLESPLIQYPVSAILQENGQTGSSFFSRFSINLNAERVILISNIALLILGMLDSFSMRLPLRVIGLASYGIFYLFLDSKAKNSRQSNTQLEAKVVLLEEKNRQNEEKLKANLKGTEMLESERVEFKELRKQVEQLEKKKEKAIAERNAAKVARDQYLSERPR